MDSIPLLAGYFHMDASELVKHVHLLARSISEAPSIFSSVIPRGDRASPLLTLELI